MLLRKAKRDRQREKENIIIFFAFREHFCNLRKLKRAFIKTAHILWIAFLRAFFGQLIFYELLFVRYSVILKIITLLVHI